MAVNYVRGLPILEKILSGVEEGSLFRGTPCLLWIGSGLNTDGYGRILYQGKRRPLHALIYELQVGAIGIGLEIDHLCRNRSCLQIKHLEAVTHQVNTQRGYDFGDLGRKLASLERQKTQCPSGHPYSLENTVYEKDGSRKCLICKRKRCRDYHRKRKVIC